MSNLSYEEYNDRAFVVYGDREKFTKTLRELGGRWNSRLKNGPGWTLPREKEEDLKKIIESLENDKDKQIDLIKQNVKSRKEQNKYCRAVSNSSSDEKQSPPKTEPAPQVEPVEKVKQSASASSSSSDAEDHHEEEVKISVEENLLKERKEKERKKFEQEKREHEAKQKSQVQQSNSQGANSQGANSQRTNSHNGKELEQPREVSRQAPRESRDAPRESREVPRESRDRRHSRDRREGREVRESRESRDAPRESRQQPRESRERRHSRDRREGREVRESRQQPRDNRKEDRETGRDNINYYKSFAKKKDTFKALYEKSESDTFTSSSEEESSSDDFPTPESPKRRNHKNRSVEEDKLYNKVKDLQKQLYEMQIKQKKQKYEKK